ncbi:hypothetical protein LEM8419_00181 [Neolewinella maritima]|uniref:Transporter substrate-binding domain-containing protein n=1 Tax=Neolewinella maritima TaxID=1383882 RepID=A0ABM9AW10_9BACT|nr:transporter substrate-binding domain-containing protein [Neolewinella maritima]CAH0998866.1 hypothetical protein LEM8419_00181 [Neolewinella maritima]
MRAFLAFVLLVSLYQPVSAQADSSATLRVGIVERAPHAMQDDQGNWSGLAVECWRQVAEREQLTYEWVSVEERDSLLPLVGRRIDVLLQAPVTANGTREVDYLQPYHTTTLAVAQPKRNSIWQVARNLFSLQFFYIVLALSALLILIGTAMYFLERGGNEDQFGGERSVAEGVGAGFWWAGVTLTTIGYGDKAPHTLGGRIVAMLWMLTALALTSSLTAGVISALNKDSTISFPDDLRNKTVGATAHSQAAEYLEDQDISFRPFDTALDGLQQLNKGEIDLYVDNTSAIRYAVNSHKAVAANIQSTATRPQSLAIAVEKGSPLRDRLDAAVVRVTLSESWREALTEYGAIAE